MGKVIKFANVKKAEDPIAPVRKPAHEILHVEDAGPSPTGSTFYKSMLRCPREHALSTKVKLRTVRDKEALTVGWLFHLAMENYHRALFRGASKDEARNAAFDSYEKLRTEEGYEETFSTVDRVVTKYFENYVRDDYKVLAVEETLVYKNDFSYSARLDLFIEQDGWSWIKEHKTARAITEDLVGSYALDMQILGQVWLLKKCVDLSQYPKFAGVIVNIATKAKEPKFERVKVCPSDSHLRMFEQNLRMWTNLRNEYAKAGWPQALGSCSGFARGYTTCEFFKLCHDYPERGVRDWEGIASDRLPEGFTCGGKVAAIDE